MERKVKERCVILRTGLSEDISCGAYPDLKIRHLEHMLYQQFTSLPADL